MAIRNNNLSQTRRPQLPTESALPRSVRQAEGSQQTAESRPTERTGINDNHSFDTSQSEAGTLQNAIQSNGSAPAGAMNAMSVRMTADTSNRSGDICMDAFERSAFSLADAEAAMQKFPDLEIVEDAMEFIGAKILDNDLGVLASAGITVHNFDSHDCMAAFRQSAYSEADAKAAFENFGFLHSVEDAKEYIGLKIVNDYEEMLGEVGISRHDFDDHDCLAAFEASDYSAEDVKAAVKAFDFLHSFADAKEYIGLKIVNRYEEMLDGVGITETDFDSHDMMAAFRKSGYSEADAKAALEKFGFLETVTDAKEYIGLKVMNGTENLLREVGINRHSFDSHDEMDAFTRSGYTTADAKAAVAEFDFLHSIKDAKEYIGLKVINNYEEMLSDVGISRGHYDRHDMVAAFKQSGYKKEHAKAAVEAFDFLHTVKAAKEYIGLKIINGNEGLLADAGISPGSAQDPVALKGFCKFAQSDYNFADAKMLADHWNTSIDDAKAKIGATIGKYGEDIMAKVWSQAKGIDYSWKGDGPQDGSEINSKAIHSYANSSYNYNDAEMLASFWGVGIADAKVTIGNKLMAGDDMSLRYTWKMAESKIGLPNNNAKAFDAYANSDYTWQDAETLSTYWDCPLADAKMAIGNKLLDGDRAALNMTLKYASRELNDPKFPTHPSDIDGKAFDSYLNSDYNYNDAEMLASFWGVDVADAKVTIGNKLMAGDDMALQYTWKMAESKIGLPNNNAKAFDAYANSDYTWQDAETLSTYWDCPIADAKIAIGSKLLDGDRATLNMTLKYASRELNGSVGPQDGADLNGKAFDSYLNSNYNYNDAEMLASFWGVDVADAKLTIGNKLMAGDDVALQYTWKMAESKIGLPGGETGNEAAWVAYADSQYGYNDASMLATAWDMSLDDAKLYIGRKVAGGDMKALDNALHEAKISTTGETGNEAAWVAYADSPYGYNDASMLATAWDMSLDDAKLYIGTKVASGDVKALDNALHEAKISTTGETGNEAAWVAYADSQYGYNDASMLATAWDMSLDDAKLYIGTKVASGDVKALDNALHEAKLSSLGDSNQ